MEEVRAALTRINTDAHRASEIIQSIRSIFKRGAQELAPLDMNALVWKFLGSSMASSRIFVFGLILICGPISRA